MTAKSVLVRPQGLRPRARAPTCRFATPLPAPRVACLHLSRPPCYVTVDSFVESDQKTYNLVNT